MYIHPSTISYLYHFIFNDILILNKIVYLFDNYYFTIHLLFSFTYINVYIYNECITKSKLLNDGWSSQNLIYFYINLNLLGENIQLTWFI